jgi:GT2 family glycosyltransferase
VKEEISDVLVAVLYHSKLGENFSKMLESLANIKPYSNIILLFIDNYSKDGAHDLVNSWIDRYGERYKGIIHVRARGNPVRLRNIALKLGYDIGVKYLSFIESDVIVDEDFLTREFKLMKEYQKNVISVSAVRYTPYEYLDFFEKCITKWLRGRNTVNAGVFEGEAFNSGNCLIDLSKVPEVGWFDEDIVFIEDLDWGRRATRRGFVCLFDGRVQLLHMKKYSVKDLRKYFFKGALSEAKLFLKNRLAKAALRRISYWNGLFLSMLIIPYNVHTVFNSSGNWLGSLRYEVYGLGAIIALSNFNAR